MANSLLAHLYTHIKGSQEDIATLSLQYILSQSTELRTAFTKKIGNTLSSQLSENLNYSCQQAGKNKERPDMAGINSDGYEEVLCEMKFYAGLTHNQPLAYLERLESNNGKGLIFICPERRKVTLWSKLKEICSDAEKTITAVDEYCISVNSVNMAVITWSEILYLLTNVASATAVQYLPDIQQLDGYCKQMDSDELLPFDNDDLSAKIARDAERYYAVLDKLIDLLEADKSIITSTKSLKASANRNGYIRSIYIDDFGVTVSYDRELWKRNSSVETPFWVSVRTKEWKETEEILSVLKGIDANRKEISWCTHVAFEPLMHSTMDEVAEDLKKQLLSHINKFRHINKI